MQASQGYVGADAEPAERAKRKEEIWLAKKDFSTVHCSNAVGATRNGWGAGGSRSLILRENRGRFTARRFSAESLNCPPVVKPNSCSRNECRRSTVNTNRRAPRAGSWTLCALIGNP